MALSRFASSKTRMMPTTISPTTMLVIRRTMRATPHIPRRAPIPAFSRARPARRRIRPARRIAVAMHLDYPDQRRVTALVDQLIHQARGRRVDEVVEGVDGDLLLRPEDRGGRYL